MSLTCRSKRCNRPFFHTTDRLSHSVDQHARLWLFSENPMLGPLYFMPLAYLSRVTNRYPCLSEHVAVDWPFWWRRAGCQAPWLTSWWRWWSGRTCRARSLGTEPAPAPIDGRPASILSLLQLGTIRVIEPDTTFGFNHNQNSFIRVQPFLHRMGSATGSGDTSPDHFEF